jgi:hypothetical protein
MHQYLGGASREARHDHASSHAATNFRADAHQAPVPAKPCPDFDPGGLRFSDETCADLGVASLEHDDVGALTGEVLQICDRSLPLRAAERRLNGGNIVEMQDRDQMVVGGALRA